MSFKQSIDTFVRLETADDEITLAAADGSLISYIKIDGSRQIIGEEEYNYLVEGSTIKIGSRFDRQGHALQVYFVRDPNRIAKHLEDLLRPSRLTAEAIELDVKDIFDERVRHLSRYLSYEECYYVLWTRPSVLTKNELKRAATDYKRKKWVKAGFGQNPLAALDALRTRHKSYIASIMSSLDELGIRAELMNVHDALRAIKNNLYPTKAHEDWRACLPGDPIPPRTPLSRVDLSDIV